MAKVETADLLSDNDFSLLLERTARLTVPPTAFFMMLTYAVFALSHLLILTAPASYLMSTLALATAILCGWVWRHARNEIFSFFRAHDLLGGMALAALANITAHMLIEDDRLQTTYIAICIMGCGFLILDRTWFVVSISTYLVAWGLIYPTLSPVQNSYHFEYFVFVAIAIAIATHIGRLRSTTYAEVLRIKAERRREESESQLRHAARLITMGELVASIAHELNQPLSAISNYATSCKLQLARTDFDETVLRTQFESIADTALRAGEIIKRIRRLASNSGSTRKSVDLNQVIRDSIAVMDTNLRHQNINIQLELSSDLPDVQADEIQMQQVIINLLRNSVESIQQSTAIKNGSITLRTSAEQEGPRVTVADNGPGIQADMPNSIFDAFCTTKPDGMGMGLAICRSIVENHGGKIWHSPRGNTNLQTEFSFSIPIANGEKT